MKLSAIVSVLALAATSVAFPAPLRIRQLGTSDTENNLVDGTPCQPLTLIYARGTTEPGNVGKSLGPTFFTALVAATNSTKLAVQGVDYPASIFGFLEGGDPHGSVVMANLVTQATTQCPQTKISMIGYSQGGQLVHKAAALLSAAVSAKVNSVLVFGDPDKGQTIGTIATSKIHVICHPNDDICNGGIITGPNHNYLKDVGEAAAFVAAQSRLP